MRLLQITVADCDFDANERVQIDGDSSLSKSRADRDADTLPDNLEYVRSLCDTVGVKRLKCPAIYANGANVVVRRWRNEFSKRQQHRRHE